MRPPGRAVVADLCRDVGIYRQEAGDRGSSGVIGNRIHADFLSGHLELADRRGHHLRSRPWRGLPMEPLHDGERLSLGEVILEIPPRRATPNRETPEIERLRSQADAGRADLARRPRPAIVTLREQRSRT